MDWQSEHYDRELIMGVQFSHRSSIDLLQNCDLPPPLKLFSPFDGESDNDDKKRRTVLSSLPPSQLIPPPPPAPNKIDQWDDELGLKDCSENASLLRALQLSQSRAREAEKKASLTSISSNQMAVLLLEESSRLSAHRQWVKLLEIEVSLLQQQQQQKVLSGKEEQRDEEAVPAITWCLTLALCLGIGIALGRYMF